jgi:predicted RNA binding protein YcfA (HicA-like mRNA interferase family)
LDMKLPRDLPSSELIKLLVKVYGYEVDRQQGSHIILTPPRARMRSATVPNHVPLSVGTLNAILREVAVDLGLSKMEGLQALFE